MSRITLALLILGGLLPMACSAPVGDGQPTEPMQMAQPLAGQWQATQGGVTLWIFPNNRFAMRWQTPDGTIEQRRGSLVATDHQLRVLYDPDAPDCVNQLGIYAWQRMGDTLALGVVRDGCDQRAGKLTRSFIFDAGVTVEQMKDDADPTEPQRDTEIEHTIINMSPDAPIGQPETFP